MTDAIDHPPHYTVSDVEPIDAIEAWRLGYHLGCVVKYIARHEHKGSPLEDLKKARWYLDRYIGRLEGADEESGGAERSDARAEGEAGGRVCMAPGCSSPHKARGLCKRHYELARRKGHLDGDTP